MVGLSPAGRVIYRDQNLAALLRDRLFGANLYLPSVPLELPMLPGECQVSRLAGFYEDTKQCLKSKMAERHAKHYQIAKDPIRGEPRANRFYL